MKIPRTLRETQLILLLPAVMWLYTNALINTHYHYLSDGQIISHAHPYDKATDQGTPFKSHQHTKAQLIFLSLIDKTDVVIAGFLIIGLLITSIPKRKVFTFSEIHVKVYYLVFNYHAPPAF